MEILYQHAIRSSVGIVHTVANQKFVSDSNGLDTLRQSLGHPLNFVRPISCIVASTNGMDAASCGDRLLVASELWSNGVSAEYLAQSGVMISLLKETSKTESLGELASVSKSYFSVGCVSCVRLCVASSETRGWQGGC